LVAVSLILHYNGVVRAQKITTPEHLSQRLAAILAHNPGLTFFELQGQTLDSDVLLQPFTDAIRSHGSLREASFFGNHINDAGALTIAKALLAAGESALLRKLNLGGNPVKPQTQEEIRGLGKGKRLKILTGY
jgi:hypothetical protein